MDVGVTFIADSWMVKWLIGQMIEWLISVHHPLAALVRGAEDAEKAIMYRLKSRIAGIPILSNWDIWKASYAKNKRAYFFH
jgi:hypothetical protein